MTTLYEFRIFDHGDKVDVKYLDHIPYLGEPILVCKKKMRVMDVSIESMILHVVYYSEWNPKAASRGHLFQRNGIFGSVCISLDSLRDWMSYYRSDVPTVFPSLNVKNSSSKSEIYDQYAPVLEQLIVTLNLMNSSDFQPKLSDYKSLDDWNLAVYQHLERVQRINELIDEYHLILSEVLSNDMKGM